MPLRNEDYIGFLDESGEDGLQVVSGVLIPARWLRSAERRWHDFVRDRLGSRSGRREVKGKELVRGEGAALHAQRRLLASGHPPISAKGAGQQFFRNALNHIASIYEVRTLSVGLHTNRPLEAYQLWYWLMSGLLVEKARAPRPRLPLIVIDGEDAKFRASWDLITYRFYKAFPRCQPYVGAGNSWFVGGAIHQDSQLHPFIQMADLVAGAARHSIAQRQPYASWYANHLKGHARSLGRQIDVSARATAQLRSRDPQDTKGIGWPNALVP
ncbi:MAG: DUF3800 domain-containing protein [Solirubrobacterales bacterium]